MTSRYWSSLHRRLQRHERSTAGCRRSALSTDDRSHEQSTPRMIRSYDVEHTRSRPISEVKLRSARPVLGTEMAWEALVTNLLPFFASFFPSSALVFALQRVRAVVRIRAREKRARTGKKRARTTSLDLPPLSLERDPPSVFPSMGRVRRSKPVWATFLRRARRWSVSDPCYFLLAREGTTTTT